MKFFLSFILLFTIWFTSGQSNKNVDSLKGDLRLKKDTFLLKTLDEIVWKYKSIDIDSALKYSKKSLKLAEKLEYNKLTALVYNTHATVYEAKSELDSALYFHKRSLTISISINDSIGVANTYNNLGIIHDEKGEYLKALEYYFKALKTYENNNAPYDRLSLVYVNIGIVYKKQKEFRKALDYYHKAIFLYKENNNKTGETISISNISSIYLKLKDYKKAIKYSKEAIVGFKNLGYIRYISYAKHNIAIAKTGLKQFKESIAIYKEIIPKFYKENNLFELVDAKINLAKTYIQTKEYIKATKELKESLLISKENSFKEKEIRILSLLSNTSFKSKEFKKAYKYLKEYDLRKDTVFEKEKTKSILELEIKYENEKKEKELLKVRAEKAETELELSNAKIWTFLLVSSLIILAILSFAIFQSNKRKHQIVIANQKQKSLQSIVNAEEKERVRIARELHDGVVQEIGSIILKSRSLFKKKNLIEDVESIDLLENLENSNNDLRNISHQMMPKALSELGLIPAIDDLTKSSLYYANIKYTFEHFNIDDNDRLPENIEITLYRIAQELINNIIKHSKAKLVSIQLIKSNKHILLVAEDDGIGIDKLKLGNGIGVTSIKSRLEMIKGEVNFDIGPEKGTIVTIKIPI